ncbi:MAG TPA: 2-C-methyl-D-erythritol 4-phosphate cytidylyltransferase [Desulfomonilia bacterium]|nr:2-C-methyl-D-erythritol 4-phosphate cytidylyltransferase [Desulfomonilia bacterium]
MSLSAVIVAGGSGARFGLKKQFLDLAGTPVLKRAVSCFDDHSAINRLIIVVPEEDISHTLEILANTRTEYVIAGGGSTRQESVMNGLLHARDSRTVLIHDGVRPLASRQLIDRVLKGLSGYEGCIPAIEVTDTLKEVRNGVVVKTIPRGRLYQVQTPQAFVTKILVSAHEKALNDGSLQFTDDSSLIEAAGKSVRIVEGDPLNVKITYKDDILVAEAILRCRTESE